MKTKPVFPVPSSEAVALHPQPLGGAAISTQHNRFLAERTRRAENLTRRNESGRCPDCGESCGHYSRCRHCRMRLYIERGAVCHWIAPGARLNYYPEWEYATHPTPLAGIVDGWEVI